MSQALAESVCRRKAVRGRAFIAVRGCYSMMLDDATMEPVNYEAVAKESPSPE